MTECLSDVHDPAGLVLGGLGSRAQLEARIPAAAARLAGLAGLPLRQLDAHRPPSLALAELGPGRSSGQPPAWLAALALDPGLPLDGGGSWAESLGAWRQPTALLVEADQLATGWPAAATALLRSWRVPLLGLIQGRGRWEPAQRRADGLPWLGRLAEECEPPALRAEDDAVLAAVLARRWAALDLL